MIHRKYRIVSSIGVSLLLFSASTLLALDREEASFDSNGVEIRYLSQGQGDPVILIHGFSSTADANWVIPGVFDRLASEFWVIALDARGHGKSGKPHAPEQYGMEMVDDVLRLMDHLKLDQAHVVGYSMGGFITMELLSQAPERLLSATVGGAGWVAEGTDPDPLMARLAASLEAGDGILPLLEALQPTGSETPPRAQLEAMSNMVMANNDPIALAALIRALAGLAVTREQLDSNQVPTLAIIGSLDPLKAGVDAMDGVMKKLKIVVIDDADHISPLVNPDHAAILTDEIRSFLISTCNCA